MLGAFEILLIVLVFGVLFLIQTRTRAGSLGLYVTVGILLLMVIVAMRVIRSLLGAFIVLLLVCLVLAWRIIRSG